MELRQPGGFQVYNALAAASAVSFGAQTVFVAPGGSDSEGLGTKEKPFASLNRAIREFYSSKPGDFEICVAEGEYFFSKGVYRELLRRLPEFSRAFPCPTPFQGILRGFLFRR